MRDLIFKNHTSSDKTKRLVSTYETIEERGKHTAIRRHFVYKLLDITDSFRNKPEPEIVIQRNLNRALGQETVFCRLKGSMYVRTEDKLLLVLFSRSLRIASRS